MFRAVQKFSLCVSFSIAWNWENKYALVDIYGKKICATKDGFANFQLALGWIKQITLQNCLNAMLDRLWIYIVKEKMMHRKKRNQAR